MKIKILIIILDILLFVIFLFAINKLIRLSRKENNQTARSTGLWEVRSIDTMKYSRDLAREMINSAEFDEVIKVQTKEIADTGATHIALGTPYDSEFVPFLGRWVAAARAHKLKVWFRGNFAGWEGWFEYPKISREEHTKKIEEFIVANPNLFQDGDIFSSCPECENGGPGDPRKTGDIEGYRKFLIDEYIFTKNAFRKIKKDVIANYYSMNGDVAKLVMDQKTTASLDGVVVIDHYVDTSEKLFADVKEMAKLSGGDVVLGEFGAPIPDIHGPFSESEQAAWIKESFLALSKISELKGINYWVGSGGSTRLWNDDGSARLASEVVKNFYSMKILEGRVVNRVGKPIIKTLISSGIYYTETDAKGKFLIPLVPETEKIKFEAQGYIPQELTVSSKSVTLVVVLEKSQEDFIFKAGKMLHNLLD
jgi:hypothetical protein